jgi:regulator of protease activity HflC (stomatin/prohibitin superfamily)
MMTENAAAAHGARTPLVPTPHQNSMRSEVEVASRSQAMNDDQLMREQEQTPAYRALYDKHLICNKYRVRRVGDLDIVLGSWDLTQSNSLQLVTCNGCCCLIKFFVVNSGNIRCGIHQNGSFLFFGEGVHVLPSPYVTLTGREIPLTQGSIVNGTKAIVTVTQGFVGYAMDRGQPILLPPGMHQWDSPTIEFQELIDLSSSIIRLGPFTLITVDEGYAAVTQDNGEQKILEGGQAYMLTHRNWKFEKFMTKKLQTNDVGPIKVTTGDNVNLIATATVNWLIEDAALAARNSANTMNRQMGPGEFDIPKLREDVIRQVTASLAAFIGSVSYSKKGGGTAAMSEGIEGKKGGRDVPQEPDPEEDQGRKALFDHEKLNSSVHHANEVCHKYGVKIMSINLISASPSDPELLTALSQGAVATVAADQTETAARGQAAATILTATAEANAKRIRAEGTATADAIRAEGSLRAAKRIEESEVAVTLAKISSAGTCLKEGNASSYFFGLQSAEDIPGGMVHAKPATGKKR